MKHIDEVILATKGKLIEWDVMNEPFDNFDLMEICGDDIMVDFYKRAKERDNKTKLFINDYGILSGGGKLQGHQDHYYKTIEYIKNNEGPIEGIGMQGHFSYSVTPPETLWRILDRFSEFSIPIGITEFDVAMDDEEYQAQYTRDFMTAIFAHPQTNEILMWGFWEEMHWKPEAAIYRTDFSLKPNGKVWRELIYDKWWTTESGKTNDKGIFGFRGFKGDYAYVLKDGEGKIVKKGTFKIGEKPLALTIRP